MIFTPQQMSALRTLARVWSTHPFVLIGASALGCFMRMRWRKTGDLDLVLALSVEDYPAGLERDAGWTRHPHRENRWVAPGEVYVDVIPAGKPGPGEAVLRWPGSGFEMNLAGLRLAFEKAVTVEVEEGLTIRAAPVEVVALLKMIAYQDRPHDRERDLGDIAYILEEYISESDSRRYGEDVLDLGLPYDDISPFLLGRDLSAIVIEPERRLIVKFVSKLRAAGDPAATQARMLAVAPSSWRKDPDELLSRITAFESGLGIPVP